MAQSIALHVNGHAVGIDVDDPEMPLLYALRDNLGLHGPRFGCGLGQCGACTVHLDGAAVHSCITQLQNVANRHIVTLEGLGKPSFFLSADMTTRAHPPNYRLARRRCPSHSERG